MPLCFSDYKGLWYTHGLMEPHNYVCVLRGGRLKLGVGKGRKQAAYFFTDKEDECREDLETFSRPSN